MRNDSKVQLREIRKWCKRFWKDAQHPHFTLHGIEHSNSILKKLKGWLKHSNLRLSPVEWFILEGAVYLHDIGMQCRNAEFLRNFANIRSPAMPLTKPKDLEKVRKHHAKLSYHMIRDACRAPRERQYSEFSLDGTAHSQAFQAMALISRGHTGDIPKEVTNDYRGIPGGPIRLELLQWLLRVGDALDVEADRVNHDYVSQAWTSLRPQDRFHTLKHEFVSNIAIVGAGVFQYSYALPEKCKKLYDVIRVCAEAPLQKHLKESGSRIRDMGLPFAEIRSRLQDKDAICPYEIKKDVIEVFRQEARQLSMGARLSNYPKPWVMIGDSNPQRAKLIKEVLTKEFAAYTESARTFEELWGKFTRYNREGKWRLVVFAEDLPLDDRNGNKFLVRYERRLRDANLDADLVCVYSSAKPTESSLMGKVAFIQIPSGKTHAEQRKALCFGLTQVY